MDGWIKEFLHKRRERQWFRAHDDDDDDEGSLIGRYKPTV
jgi:hypothetical protein